MCDESKIKTIVMCDSAKIKTVVNNEFKKYKNNKIKRFNAKKTVNIIVENKNSLMNKFAQYQNINIFCDLLKLIELAQENKIVTMIEEDHINFNNIKYNDFLRMLLNYNKPRQLNILSAFYRYFQLFSFQDQKNYID